MFWKPLLFSLSATLLLPAQDEEKKPLLVNPTVPEESEEHEEPPSATDASVFNQNKARTFTISVPAPRGLILDREGRPLAQTKVAYHLALDFTAYDGPADSESAVAWAQERVKEANELVKGDESYSDKKLACRHEDRPSHRPHQRRRPAFQNRNW